MGSESQGTHCILIIALCIGAIVFLIYLLAKNNMAVNVHSVRSHPQAFHCTGFLFVTAFIDTGRENWSEKGISFERSNDLYVQSFRIMSEKLPLIAYIDDRMQKHLSSIKIPQTTEIRNVKDVDTFMKYKEIDQEIMDSEEYKNRIPIERKNYPEHCSAAYCLANHSKVNFLSHAASHCMGHNTFVAWVDFGILNSARWDISILPSLDNIDYDKIATDKVTIQAKNPLMIPDKVLKPGELLIDPNPRIAGGFSIIPINLAVSYEAMYDQLLSDWRREGICDDDQAATYELWSRYPHLISPLSNTKGGHEYFFMWNELKKSRTPQQVLN